MGVHAGVPTQRHGSLTSVSREAKAAGIKSGMRSREAKRLLPSLHVLAQRPVEYIRLHHALVACIENVVPVREVHSVDEVSIELTPSDDPAALMGALQEAVYSSFSPALTFAAGVASSAWLAKVAAECGKGPAGERGGAIDWTRPGALPEVLFDPELEDLPKVGVRKVERLRRYGIESVRAYCEAPPSRIRDAFGSVDGERIWLAMHGHDVRWTRRTTPESMPTVAGSIPPGETSRSQSPGGSLYAGGSGRGARGFVLARSGFKARRRRRTGRTKSRARSRIREVSGRPWEPSVLRGGHSESGACRTGSRLSSTSCPRIRGSTSISWKVPISSTALSIARLPRSGIGSASGQFAVVRRGIRRDPTPGSRSRSSGCRRWRRWPSSGDRGSL